MLQQAHADDPGNESAMAMLAAGLVPSTPAAEAIRWSRPPEGEARQPRRAPELRARLTNAQRYGDASAQLEVVTRAGAGSGPPWLTLGARCRSNCAGRPRRSPRSRPIWGKLENAGHCAGRPTTTTMTTPPARRLARAGAAPRFWLLLAQAAEQQHDYKGAEGWLAKVDNPQRALEVQTRRASLLARQGKIKERAT